MRRLQMLWCVLIAAPLAACATSGDLPKPNIPPVPPDVARCERTATDLPDRALTAEEIERLWKTDRAALGVVSNCLHRSICQTADTRRRIGGVDDPLCRKR